MSLLVDIGNTRLKWALCAAGELSAPNAIVYERDNTGEAFKSALSGIEVGDEVLVANVAGETVAADFSRFCSASWSLEPRFARVSGQLAGVTNGYENIEQLGIDRWLAIAAAWQRYKTAVCVIDCGTALTLDIVDTEAHYIGGYIIPGAKMMVESLSMNTQQIEVGSSETMSLEPGLGTSDCVNRGAFTACVASINTILARYCEKWGKNFKVILTGGAAGDIRPHVQFEADHDPWLVLRGLQLLMGEST